MARAERMEVMTIIQPLRRPGHVSMALGFFPAHIGIIQRLPIHPKADCPSPFKLNTPHGPTEPPFPPAWINQCSNLFYTGLTF